MSTRPQVVPVGACGASRHGDTAAYDWWGCRCPTAREAHRLYRKRLRENRQPAAHVSSLGSSRRLQALVAAGYNWRDLGQRLGVDARVVRGWATPERPTVHRDTVERITALFAELATTPGPSQYARTVAARRGWLPPLAWDDFDDPAAVPSLGDEDAGVVDEVAVERALRGEPVPLTDTELVAAVQVGSARGLAAGAVADLLHVDFRLVQRLLSGDVPPRLAAIARHRLANLGLAA